MFSKIHFFSKDKNSGASNGHSDFSLKVRRDWRNLLLFMLALGAVVIILDGYLLWRVSQGDFFVSSVVDKDDTTSSDQKILSNTVKFFDERAANFNAFKNTPPSEIDPSL